MKAITASAQYFQQLLHLWLYWFVFPILDLVLLVSDHLVPAVSVPPIAYWILLAIGFLLANVKLFADQQDRISELEATQADICVTLRGSAFDHSHSGRRPPFPDVRETGPYGFDAQGMPGWAELWATLEIENVGYEPGELVLEVVRPRTKLPGLFAVDERNNGWFHGGPLRSVEARDHITVQWCLDIRITEQDPGAFAQALQSLSTYRVVLQYHTRRIGGESGPSTLVIEGDFSDFRRNVLEHWNGFGFSHLVQLVSSDC